MWRFYFNEIWKRNCFKPSHGTDDPAPCYMWQEKNFPVTCDKKFFFMWHVTSNFVVSFCQHVSLVTLCLCHLVSLSPCVICHFVSLSPCVFVMNAKFFKKTKILKFFHSAASPRSEVPNVYHTSKHNISGSLFSSGAHNEAFDTRETCRPANANISHNEKFFQKFMWVSCLWNSF